MQASGKYNPGEVQIIWRKKIVTLKQRKVVWYDDADEVCLTSAAKAVESEVDG